MQVLQVLKRGLARGTSSWRTWRTPRPSQRPRQPPTSAMKLPRGLPGKSVLVTTTFEENSSERRAELLDSARVGLAVSPRNLVSEWKVEHGRGHGEVVVPVSRLKKRGKVVSEKSYCRISRILPPGLSFAFLVTFSKLSVIQTGTTPGVARLTSSLTNASSHAP